MPVRSAKRKATQTACVELLHGPRSVSYTHLDVYKRQHLYQIPEQDFIEGFGRALIDGAIAFSIIVADTIMTPSAKSEGAAQLYRAAPSDRRERG